MRKHKLSRPPPRAGTGSVGGVCQVQASEGVEACTHSGFWVLVPQASIPLYLIGQQRCFRIPGMGVLGLHNAKKYCLGSGVATQTPIPLYLIGQERWFWIPWMGLFEQQNAKKTLFGFWGGALNTHTTVPHRPNKGVFGYLGWGCLNCTTAKKFFVFWGGAPDARTTVSHRPAQVFLDTWDGAV